MRVASERTRIELAPPIQAGFQEWINYGDGWIQCERCGSRLELPQELYDVAKARKLESLTVLMRSVVECLVQLFVSTHARCTKDCQRVDRTYVVR